MKQRAFWHVPLLLALIALLVLPLSLGAAPSNGARLARPPFAPGRVLVKFRSGASVAGKAAVHRALGARAVRVIPGIDVEVVSVSPGAERAKARAYARRGVVEYAEPDYVATALGDPNDEFFDKQWGLDNDGQPYDGRQGTEDADIDAPEAWGITTGSASIVIAILDSGIDQDHPDLDGKLMWNINFTNSPTVDDRYGHGTHVAGIAAAESNNAIGVAGVCHNCSLMNVKVLDDDGWGYYSWIADGIRWAAYNDANVINMSLGGYQKSRTLESAVKYAWSEGAVLVAAAGNWGSAKRPAYPAAYRDVIAVTALDQKRRIYKKANSGAYIDFAAPGVRIYAAVPRGGRVMSGTSFATPYIAVLLAMHIEAGAPKSPGTLRQLLSGRVLDLGDPGRDDIFGYGIVKLRPKCQ